MSDCASINPSDHHAAGIPPGGTPDLDYGGVPSPFDPVCERASDPDDWISFPAFYAHLVRTTGSREADVYALRVRGSDGVLQLQTERTSDVKMARKWVERAWVNCLRFSCFITFDDVLDGIIERWRTLNEMKLVAEHLTPIDARYPFCCIPHEQWRLLDPVNFPTGFPIVVEQLDKGHLRSEEVITRGASGIFEYYSDYNARIGDAQNLVEHILIYQNLISEAHHIACNCGDYRQLDYFKTASTSKRIRISDHGEYEAVIPPKRRYLRP